MQRVWKLLLMLGVFVFLFGVGLSPVSASQDKDVKVHKASAASIKEINKYVGKDISYYKFLSILHPEAIKDLPKELKELYKETPYRCPASSKLRQVVC